MPSGIRTREEKRLLLEAQLDNLRIETDQRNEFQDEVRAEALGLDATLTGKRIQRQGRKDSSEHVKREEEKNTAAIMRLFQGVSAPNSILLDVLKTASDTLRTAFTTRHEHHSHAVVKNGSHIVFEENLPVTLATQAVIQKQQDMLAVATKEFQTAARNPEDFEAGERMRRGRYVFALAEQFDMIRHPDTKSFVPSFDSVQELEQLHNPIGNMECKGLVCAFRLNSHSVSGRGIKRTISDVFDDNNPSETKLTTTEQISKPAVPSSAPALNLN